MLPPPAPTEQTTSVSHWTRETCQQASNLGYAFSVVSTYVPSKSPH